MKTIKLLFWLFMTLFTLSMLSAAGLYFFNYGHAQAEFSQLGFPEWLIYPLGVAKIAAVIGVWQQKSKTARTVAYAGSVFNVALAFGAHWFAYDGEWFGPVVVFLFIAGSYYFQQKKEQEVN